MNFSDSIQRLDSELPTAKNAGELVQLLQAEVKRMLGINTVWLFLQDAEDGDLLHLLTYSGTLEESATPKISIIPVKGDPFLEEVIYHKKAVYCLEAMDDPRTNKELVEAINVRTIFNTPISMGNECLGVLGTGTFAEEGTRALSMVEQDYLRTLGHHIAEAIQRFHTPHSGGTAP